MELDLLDTPAKNQSAPTGLPHRPRLERCPERGLLSGAMERVTAKLHTSYFINALISIRHAITPSPSCGVEFHSHYLRPIISVIMTISDTN